MIARNVTEEQIHEAAERVGVRAKSAGHYPRDGREPLASKPCRKSTTGEEIRFVIRTSVRRYQRLSRNTGRVVPGDVCWHGHRDFFRALFEIAPDAWVKTAKAVYAGREGFEKGYRATLSDPRGPWGPSIPYHQACTCTAAEVES